MQITIHAAHWRLCESQKIFNRIWAIRMRNRKSSKVHPVAAIFGWQSANFAKQGIPSSSYYTALYWLINARLGIGELFSKLKPRQLFYTRRHEIMCNNFPRYLWALSKISCKFFSVPIKLQLILIKTCQNNSRSAFLARQNRCFRHLEELIYRHSIIREMVFANRARFSYKTLNASAPTHGLLFMGCTARRRWKWLLELVDG